MNAAQDELTPLRSRVDETKPASFDGTDPAGVAESDETLDIPDARRHAPRHRRPGRRLRPGYHIPGTRLLVTGWLGEGATSIVYRGRHVELGRPVAIKVLRDATSSPEDREQFLAEARLAVELDSPYVVDVIDFGALEDGRLYYAMEQLGPRSLETAMREGPIPVERVITLLRMACKGLAVVHRAGIVHRDIKPANLVFAERGGRERLVLVDFGIAAAKGRTCSESIIGTPSFMAPEQIRGDAVDGRTDIYALGCCAYEMLCGHHFAQGDDVNAVLAQHLDLAPREFPADTTVPKILQDLVLRCLHPDPDQRPATVAELEAELCEAQIVLGCRDDEAEFLAPPEIDEDRRLELMIAMSRRRRPTPRRFERWVMGGVMLMGSVVLGLGTKGTADSMPAEPTPVVARAQTSPTPSLSGHALEPTTSARVATITTRAQSAPDRSATEPAVEPPNDPAPSQPTEAEVLANAAPVVVVASEPAPRSSHARSTTTHRASPEPALPESQRRRPLQSRRLVRKAHRELRSGDHAQARAHFEEAIALDSSNTEAYAGLAVLHKHQGHHQKARRYTSLAARKVQGSSRPTKHSARHSRAPQAKDKSIAHNSRRAAHNL